MNKIALMLIGMVVASSYAKSSIQSTDSSCASTKFSPGNMCGTLSTLTDTSRLFVNILFYPPIPDSANTPAYLAKVKVWSESLFTEYDLRTFQDPLTRLPVPPDSEMHWSYGLIMTTKATVLALVNESYIHRLEVQTSPPSTSIYFRNTRPGKREKKPMELRVDALGRGLMRPNRSMKFHMKPLPKR